MNGYEIKAKADAATIYIYEQIGEDWLGEGLTAKQFADDIGKIGNVKEIVLKINSIGGSVFEARAMASVLKAHRARKTVDVDGICASAATYLLCVGEEVRIAEDGMVMVHSPQGVVMGSADEMRKRADVLDAVEEGMIEVYVSRTGQTPEAIRQMVRAETWMTAQEAVDHGFADSISQPLRIAAKADLSKMPENRLPFHIPEKAKDKIVVMDHAETPVLDGLKDEVQRMKRNLVMAGLNK